MGLFNRPTSKVASGSSKADNQSDDIFSHSNEYASIVAEQGRWRKEKAERAKSKREGKRKSEEGVGRSPEKTNGRTPKKKQSEESPKRRRLPGNEIGGLLKRSGIDVDSDGEDEEEEIMMEAVDEERESPKKARPGRRVGRQDPGSAAVENVATSEVIELGDSTDDEASKGGSAGKGPAQRPAPVQDEDDESDEELAALARQARHRRLQRNPSSMSATPDVTSKASPSQSGHADSNHLDQPPPDPPVKMLIVSRIADTGPLIVYRKLSQNLKEVRIAWCRHQGFDEDFTQRIFLIHRMRRVYDVTTCRSLGLDTDAEGKITMKGAEGKEGVDQLALEAVTEDIFNQLRDEKAKEDAKRTGQWDPEAYVETEEEAPAEKPAAEQLLGIVLKAKDKPDFKLKVKPVSQQT